MDKIAGEGDVDVDVGVEVEERAGLKSSGPAGENIDGDDVAQEAGEVGEPAGNATHGTADNISQAVQADTEDGKGKGEGDGGGRPRDTD